jgi:hypothetical protein
MTDPRALDAYAIPRRLAPGCQHNLGCKCDPPYWLRPSSPAEQERESKLWPVAPPGALK